MITFTRAPLVGVGEKVSSVTRNKLSEAVNDRLRTGLDGTFRMWFKVLNLVRAVRNPSESGAYASTMEFMSHFLHVAKGGAGSWPEAPAGTPEGANVVNPLMAFVFGSENVNVSYEGGRLAGDDGVPLEVSMPLTQFGIWELGKAQRGAFDPVTGNQNAPALEAARAHRRIGEFLEQAQWFDSGINRDITTASHLKKYGGTLPRPEATGDCGDGTYAFVYTFTALKPGLPAKSYSRTCGSNLRIFLYRDHYLVLNHDGSTERLECSDYVHGPFEFSQQLEHPNGAMLDEAIGEYLATFKGTDSERAVDDDYAIRDVAFDFQRFFATQYALAPAQGHMEGENLVPDYPVFAFAPGDTLGLIDGGASSFECKEGFRYIGCLLTSDNVTQATTIQVRTGPTVHQTVTVPSGSAQHIIWMDVPKNVGTVECAVVTPFSAGATVTLELACIEDRRPELCDAYLIIRRGLGGDATGATVSAVDVGNDYFDTRCLRSDQAVGLDDYASENPVVEAMRKTLRENLRLLMRPELQGYAVENGKSVLWFARKLAISGLEFDIWDGIAPPLDAVPSGQLLGGVEYAVTVDAITYNNAVVAAGETFTAEAGVTTYTGAGEVRQINGILPVAPPNGLSNEWLMFLATNVYNDSITSAFKPDNYGDVTVGLHNRCKFFIDPYDNDLTGDLMTHAAPGQPVPIMAEAASQLNYWRGSNSLAFASEATRAKFFASCQVYQPDYEVESVTMDGGLVKVTFKSRFSTATGAPSGDFGRDVSAWDRVALGAEEWRTDENAVREYLVYASGYGNCTVKAGDAGNGVNMNVNGYNVNGCCHPRFFFTRLMPKVYAETPDTEDQDEYDTRAFAAPLRWLAWTVDAICEGYINPQGGGGGGCPKQPPATYTSEMLYVQATANTGSVVEWNIATGEFEEVEGGTWTAQARNSNEEEWQTIATVTASPYIPAAGFKFYQLLFTATGPSRWVNMLSASANEFKPESFGPLPNSICYAETFNQLAAAVNLLTSVPVYVPAAIERRRITVTKRQNQAAVIIGFPTACNPNDFGPIMIGAIATADNVDFDPDGTIETTGPWTYGQTGFAAQATGNFETAERNGNTGINSACVNGSRQCILYGTMAYDELRITPDQHLAILPAMLHENIDDAELNYTVTVRRQDIWQRLETAPNGTPFTCGDSDSLRRKTQLTQAVTICRTLDFINGATSTERFLREDSPTVATPLRESDYLAYSVNSSQNCVEGASSSVSVALNGFPFCVLNFPLV